MWIVSKIFYVIAILLNLLMILHVIIMREENMVVEIFVCVGARDSSVASYWIDTLVLKN